jgi:uncharacterized protein (TIGR03083 family)
VRFVERNEAWRAIDAQRISLTDLLERLTDADWRQPSLCAGWTVRDVAAHLTFAQARLHQLVGVVLRARFDLNRAGLDSAIRRAGEPTERIIAEIRGMVGSQRHVQGVTYCETLIDILVHSQDIAVPLGRRLDMDPEAAAFAATRVWESNHRFWPRKRFDGFALTATDVDWSVGEGREVRGPIEAILLVLTGRNVALPRLTGAGAPALGGHLAA